MYQMLNSHLLQQIKITFSMKEVSWIFLKGEQIHLNHAPFSSPFSSGMGQDSPCISNMVSKDRTPKSLQIKHPSLSVPCVTPS